MSDFLIVKGEPGHAADLALVEQACFSSPWSEAQLSEELSMPFSRYFVCISDGRITGYAGAQSLADTFYITNIAVLPSYRRRGMARALLTRLIDAAMLENLDFITLEARVSNTPAISLYSSMGFLDVGTRPAFYEKPIEDACIMTLSLKDGA